MDPITVLAHSCTGENMELVVVNGVVVGKEKKLAVADEGTSVLRAKMAASVLRKRAGVCTRDRFGVRYVLKARISY